MSCMDCKSVPLSVFVSEVERQERMIRRLIVILILAMFLLATSHGILFHLLSQYEIETEMIYYAQDGAGVNIIGNLNEVNEHGTIIGYYPAQTEKEETGESYSDPAP